MTTLVYDKIVVSQVINGLNQTTNWMLNPQEVNFIYLYLLYFSIISKQKMSTWIFSNWRMSYNLM